MRGFKMAINARENMIRTSAYLPKAYREWLERESLTTGLTISNLMVMAIKAYIDQQDYLKVMPELNEQLKSLEKTGKKPDPVLTELQKIEIDLKK